MHFSHQKSIIHHSVKSASNRPTSEETFGMLKVEVSNINLGTIYRNISQLLENKLVQEIKINGIPHYNGTIIDHHHLHCTECHNIHNCGISDGGLIEGISQSYDGIIEKYEIIFSGICKSCNQKIS